MTYRVRLRAQARQDYFEALDWYAEQGVDLAERFAKAVDGVLASLAQNPRKYAIAHRGVRRALTHDFPYGVYYRVDGKQVLVMAVVHLARDPSIWKARR